MIITEIQYFFSKIIRFQAIFKDTVEFTCALEFKISSQPFYSSAVKRNNAALQMTHAELSQELVFHQRQSMGRCGRSRCTAVFCLEDRENVHGIPPALSDI